MDGRGPSPAQENPADLARTLERFFFEHPRATVLDSGQVLFDLASARYSLSAEHGRCVLQLWSEERNIVRTITGITKRKEALRLEIRRLGASRAQALDLLPDREPRTPTARSAARRNYARLLERVLGREFPAWKVQELRTAMDLEHGFGPAYVRAVLTRGQRAWAVIGAGEGESQAILDGALTQGILWLAYCRERGGGKRFFEGLKIIAPRGTTATTRSRMAWLSRECGQWELHEISQEEEELTRIDTTAQGNLEMRLVRNFDAESALKRARQGTGRLLSLLPEAMRGGVTIRAKSPSEVALAWKGLEFARVRQGFLDDSFVRTEIVSFSSGRGEVVLRAENESRFQKMAGEIFEERQAQGDSRAPYYRLQPERWLESILADAESRHLAEIDSSFGGAPIYRQVPAFSSGDRGMLDLLTANRHGRLVILEIKVGEDPQLPLQGLDYWMRVRTLHSGFGFGAESEIERHGYFPGSELTAEVPLLYYIAPALHAHPSMETILAHFSREIPWTLLAINEDWRTSPQAVYRKRAATLQPVD